MQENKEVQYFSFLSDSGEVRHYIAAESKEAVLGSLFLTNKEKRGLEEITEFTPH